MNADTQIKEILARYGEDFASNTWVVPGGKARAIYHKCIERIIAKAGIKFDPPQIIRAELDFAVMVVTGHMGELAEWSVGEASPKNNKNSYPFAMSEKRAKDRVALKLIGLHGLLYSEEEAEEFKKKDKTEDDRSSSQRMADELIAEANACRTAARVRKLEAHPEFIKMLESCDLDDKARVEAAISIRAADLLREQAA